LSVGVVRVLADADFSRNCYNFVSKKAVVVVVAGVLRPVVTDKPLFVPVLLSVALLIIWEFTGEPSV
jgi:hypothetical protein